MIYELAIPKETSESSPVSRDYDIGIANPRLVRVRIPDGHGYLARLSISSKGTAIAPELRSGTTWIRGNGDVFEYVLKDKLEGPPYTITLKGWNEDDTYPHTFLVEVT